VVLEHKNKKIEINHSIYHQNKINQLQNFIKSYSKMILLFKNIPISKALEHQLNSEDMDNLISKDIDDFEEASLMTKLFLDDKTYDKVFKIRGLVLSINDFLMQLYYNDIENLKKSSTVQKSNAYYFFRTDTTRKTESLLNELINDIRNTYN
jgi:hypothetical protein